MYVYLALKNDLTNWPLAYELNIWYGTLYVVQVKKVKPDVILGLSAVGGLFSKEVRIVACYFLLIPKHLL